MHRSSRQMVTAIMAVVLPLVLLTPLQATQRMALGEEFTNFV